MAYPFAKIEKKWQAYWEKHSIFQTPTGTKGPKFYVLDMFPYPSGAGLHVGHPEGYTATDIVARYKRMKGFNVLHPMGWDAFGLPAERYAMETGIHPAQTSRQNIATFRRQLKSLGFSYDWTREINTTEPAYYRWTQWIFLKIFNSFYDEKQKRARPIAELSIPRDTNEDPVRRRAYINSHRLAYLSQAPVNWCPKLKTGLANEEVEEWTSKGYAVERRLMYQWMLRITAYAERLLEDLCHVDWPTGTLELQKNWIGRSEGALLRFPLWEGRGAVEVFTTRPDTIYGVSYMVLAPEHPLIQALTTPPQKEKVAKYIAAAARRSELERTIEGEKIKKSGVFTGGYVRHPLGSEKIPVWIADYVLMSYGTGAIMAVPAHDQRDFAFARSFGLPIKVVITPPAAKQTAVKELQAAYTQPGVNINSDFLDGLPTVKAISRAIQELEKRNVGRAKINYKLHDWLFSRQRYWGEPIPISQDEDGNYYFPDEGQLPLLLPEVESFQPASTGESPLATAKQWLHHRGPADIRLRRETNTMPQWAGSCWYYLRFIDPHNEKSFIDPQKEAYWMSSQGIDLYVGGAEHAVLHLLYARFWHKVLYDLGLVSTPEPFHKLVHQGLILGEDGNKMSKSLGNVVNPDTVVGQHGADAFRLFEMFLGPLEQSKPWSARGIEGTSRFLSRIWRLFIEEYDKGSGASKVRIDPRLLREPPAQRLSQRERLLHTTIKKVSEDIENLSFNTAIACLMSFVNQVYQHKEIGRQAASEFILLLSPFAPHLAEELWSLLGNKDSLAYAPWPRYDPQKILATQVEIVFQVNGKVRGKTRATVDTDATDLEKMALADANIKRFVAGKEIKRVVVIKNKLVNLVCGN